MTTAALTKSPSVVRTEEPNDTFLAWDAATHPGLVRSQNEDACCLEARARLGLPGTHYLACIADGLGGCGGGGVASKMAVEAVKDEFRQWDSVSPDRFLERAVRSANLRIFETNHKSSNLLNMRTTLTVALIEGNRLFAAYAGDSRLYRLRGGDIELLTHDHSMAAEMARWRVLSKEQAAGHQGRHELTRCVGADPLLHADTLREQVQQEDIYLICSDGLWGDLTAEEMRNAILDNEPRKACGRLVELALQRGGADNMTAVVLHVEEVGSHLPTYSGWRSLLSRLRL